ncbi:autotransporter domain-containing protein [Endozoicomonas sp. Mp262]|uniref:autotransporter outer membrane beta-barrel domain-containing protein n=1 Tax=Endozoicomonas sp. Mp262 TaxID=2919499 RepID=UPI0021D8789A
MKSNNKKQWFRASILYFFLTINSHHSYGYIPGDVAIYGIGTLLLGIPPFVMMHLFGHNDTATNKESSSLEALEKEITIPPGTHPIYPVASYHRGILDTDNRTQPPMCLLPTEQCFPDEQPDEQASPLPTYGPQLPTGSRLSDGSFYSSQARNTKKDTEPPPEKVTVPPSIQPIYPVASYHRGILDTGNRTQPPMCLLPTEQCFPDEQPDEQASPLPTYGPQLPTGPRLSDGSFYSSQTSHNKKKDSVPPPEKVTVPLSIQPIYPVASYHRGILDTDNRTQPPMCLLPTEQCFPDEQPDEQASSLPTYGPQLPTGPRLSDGSFYSSQARNTKKDTEPPSEQVTVPLSIQPIYPVASYHRGILDTDNRAQPPMCLLPTEQCFPDEQPDEQASPLPTYEPQLPTGPRLSDGSFYSSQTSHNKKKDSVPPPEKVTVPLSIQPIYPVASYHRGILDTDNRTQPPMCLLPTEQCFPDEQPDEQASSLPTYGPQLPTGPRLSDGSFYSSQARNTKKDTEPPSEQVTVPLSIQPIYPVASYHRGILDTDNRAQPPMCLLPTEQCFPDEQPDEQASPLPTYEPQLPTGPRLSDGSFYSSQTSHNKKKDSVPPPEKVTVPLSIQPIYPVASYHRGIVDTDNRVHPPICALTTDQCFPHERPDETSHALQIQETPLPIGPRLEDGSFYTSGSPEQKPKTTASKTEEAILKKSEKQSSSTEAIHNHNQSTEAIDTAKSSMSNQLFIDLSEIMALTRGNRLLSSFSYGFSTLSLDDTSPDELIASTAINNYSPAFKRGAGSWHNFIQILGVKGNWQSNTANSSYKGFGLNIGFFREINDSLMVGIMAGLQNINLNIYNNKGAGKIDRLFIGPFISWYKDNWHIDSALTFITNNYTINWKNGQQSSTSEFKGTDWNLFLGAGYDIHLDTWTPGLTLTPNVGLLFIDNQYGKHKEQGSKKPPVFLGSRNRRQLIARAGLEMTYLLPDFEKPTEITALFGIQKHQMNHQKSHYNLPGSTIQDIDTTPGRKDMGFYYGFRLTRLTGNNGSIRLDYSTTNTHHGKSDSLIITFEKKF